MRYYEEIIYCDGYRWCYVDGEREKVERGDRGEGERERIEIKGDSSGTGGGKSERERGTRERRSRKEKWGRDGEQRRGAAERSDCCKVE
jgi:hypothetical protein